MKLDINPMTKDKLIDLLKDLAAFLVAFAITCLLILVLRSVDIMNAENENLRQEVISLRQEVQRLDAKTEPERIQKDYFEWLNGREK